jgi:hypothetical protein
MSFHAVDLRLAQLGFTKRTDGIFTFDLAPGVLGWLGLNRVDRYREPGEVQLCPVVGVRFQEVERVVAECLAMKVHAYAPPTMSSPLGYVMPEKRFTGWDFTPGAYDGVAVAMTNAIAVHGLAFMHSIVDLAQLRARLDVLPGMAEQSDVRRPVAAMLAGDVERARTLLDEKLTAIAARTDGAARDFRRFAEAFRGRYL